MCFISAGQTSLLQVQREFTLMDVLINNIICAVTEIRKTEEIESIKDKANEKIKIESPVAVMF